MGSCASTDTTQERRKAEPTPKTEEERKREEEEMRQYQNQELTVSDKIEKRRPAPLAIGVR